jgi:formylglycine-generating enzyme required for sulfatase activity
MVRQSIQPATGPRGAKSRFEQKRRRAQCATAARTAIESLESRVLLSGYAALQRPTELQYWDASAADNGYNFFGVGGTSYLLDMEGRVAHTWPIGTNPHLLANGDVLDASTNDPSGYSGFKEVSWDGATVWSYLETRSIYHPHHDFTRIFNPKLNAYTTLYIANKDLTYAQLIAAGADPSLTPATGAQMDAIVEVDMSGTVVWEWCFFDHLIQDYDATKPNYVGAGKTIADYPNRLDINLAGHNLKSDWLHCNSLDYNQSLDQIVINSVQGEFYVIDHGGTFTAGNPTASIATAATSAGDFLYRFGDPARYDQGTTPAVLEDWTQSTTGTKQLGGAHDIQWISNGLSGAGHFLVFNNAEYLSEHTSQSYVMEIDPYLNASGVDTGHYVNPPDAGYNTVTPPAVADKAPKLISKQVVWNYSTESNLTLFSQIGCSAQRLPNGNTLICADTEGYIMEVTPAGRTVWDYIVPVTSSGVVQVIGDNLPMVNSIFRAYRYEASYSAFSGHTLTAGATIAGRTTVENPYAGSTNYTALQRPTETQYWDSTNAYGGYTFFSAQGTSYLIDMQGRVSHSWATGSDARLLESGHVLDWAIDGRGHTGLIELDWNGNTVWQYFETRSMYHPHGDFQRIYDPKLGAYATLYLANRDVTEAECLAAGCDPADAPFSGAQVDTIVEVDMSGNIVWEWSFWDHAIQDVDATKANYVGSGKTIADYPGRIDLNLPGRPLQSNWLDCNSIDFNQSLNQIVVNSRQGEFYIIDHGNTFIAGNPSGSIALAASAAGDFLYRFGDPARYAQGTAPSVGTNWETATSGNKQIGGSSDVRWIASGLPGAGHLLVFNNNQYLYQRTPQSYVFEINPYLNSSGVDTGTYVNPPAAGYNTWTFDKDTMKANQFLSKQVVWKYGSVGNLTLFSHLGSSAQRLPNGDTLICATTEGYMVEVDSSGNVVWEYINPVTDSGIVTAIGDDLPMTNAVPRASRYASSFAGFVGHTLTADATIAGRIYSSDATMPELKAIPAGSFVMGDHFNFVDPAHPSDELPLHTVSIDAFSMGTYDITNLQYCAYLNTALSQGLIEVRSGLVYAPGGSKIYSETRQGEYALFGMVYSGIEWDGASFAVLSGHENHPVVGIRWEGAAAYCNWLSATQGYEACYNLTTWVCDFTKNGYRLPTEAEWEYAANGGVYYQQFPWGSNTNTDGTWANWEDSGDPYETGDYPWTTPVGFYNGQLHLKSAFNWPGSQASYQTSNAVNGYGLYDMGGNVWQWTNDWYSASYYSVSPSSNPTGPTVGDLMPDGLAYHGMRGGQWYNGAQYFGMSRISNRDPGYYRGPQDPNHPYYHVGFRVALGSLSNAAPTISGTTRTPTNPTAADPVWITSTVTDDGSVAGVTLTYSTGSGTGTTSTVFTETMCSTAVKPWTGAGAVNGWTVTGTRFEQRTGANYGSGNACGLEFKGGTTLNPLTDAMLQTTGSINAAGTSGYVDFWLQSLTLDGTDGWTFQLDAGSGYVTRLSELTGSSHGWQKYHYDLASGELVSGLKMRFQFTGGGTGDDDRVDLDQISVSVTTGSLPVSMTMYDDGAHSDGAAGDNVYGAQIPAMTLGTSVYYYVTAIDNAGLTSTDPAAAPANRYSYTVARATPQLQLNEFLADSTTFTPTSDYPSATLGVSVNSIDAMSGYTLLDPMHGSTTYLIDNTGQVVHTWTSAYEPGRTAYLMPNGHLFRACMAPGGLSTGGGEGGRIEERDWDGNLVWYINYATSSYMMHHDFKVLPNGNLLMLVAEKKLYADLIAAGFNPALLDSSIITDGFMVPDSVVEIQPTGSSGGTVVWQWHVWDHLIQDYSSSKANYGVVAQHPELIDANGPGIKIPEFWNHINGIDYNPTLDQIMLSARNQNEVWIIDHSTTTAQAAGHTGGTHGKGGDLLYRWGDPQMYDAGTAANRMLYQQHNTQWIPNDCPGAGDIIFFNNGLQRPTGAYSTIDEFTPPVDAAGNYTMAGSAYGPSALTWTYVASTPTSFYSAEISGTQRLPNGNTLICEGLTGRIFEITPAGQIVWQYQNPVCDTGILAQGSSLPTDPRGGYMTAVFRALKYPTTYAAFAGRTLTATGAVERYPDWIEIRNPTTSAVDMSGMYLTNDASAPTKWQIPAGVSIPASGYLLFWADGDTTAGTRHTNFSLSATGGTLSLYDIDGITLIDTIIYGQQITNISYGRSDGSGTWGYITNPTPGTANALVDNIAPTVSNSSLVLDGRQAVHLVFSEDVAGSLALGDLVLQNLTSGQTIPAAQLALSYDATTCTATATFPGYGSGILPDGNYRLTLLAGSVSDIVGNSLASDFAYDFFILGGDANRDRKVDINDLAILAQNWKGNGKVFSQGDFNYDGKVDAADLGILSSHWQQTLVSPVAAAPLSLTRAPKRTATRIIDVVA